MPPNGSGFDSVFNSPIAANQFPGVSATFDECGDGYTGFDKQLSPRFYSLTLTDYDNIRGIVIKPWIQRQPFDFAALSAYVVITTGSSLCQFRGSYP